MIWNLSILAFFFHILSIFGSSLISVQIQKSDQCMVGTLVARSHLAIHPSISKRTTSSLGVQSFNDSFSITFCINFLEFFTRSNLFSSKVFSAGQLFQFHWNLSSASFMFCQEIKMYPESFWSSRISLNHNLQVKVAFFLDSNGR